MGFGDLKTDAGLQTLNSFLEDKSYIEGYVPSQADLIVFAALSGPPKATYHHALRWFTHVSSYTDQEKAGFGGVKNSLDSYGPAGGASAAAAEDDFDLFGSDDEEEEAPKQPAPAKPKKVVIAKSVLVLDVKPWDDETDMSEIEKHVRSIEADGLVWGSSKLVPVGYGIKKLQISAVIEDDKISTDMLEERITEKEDLIQSMDIAAFNKV
ncbi:elongation factor 1-beta-like [Rhopilema esculentum]|uniref:elongation factor 1-beta-like n=1 Tax=Rhopilema esculentum TaxID=499914 RepID=UPI0031E47857|eukprot:gene13972-4935_t